MSGASVRLDVSQGLSGPQVASVRGLVEAVTEADGHPPLSEHVMLHLPGGGDAGVRHVLAEQDGRLVGYAHLDVTDPVLGPSAELAVPPEDRRHGTGRELVRALLALSPDGRLRLWAHGEHPAAGALARELGFTRSRVLWQLRRPLDAPLPEASPPGGVTLRGFVVGQDEAAWTALNNLAFADHPDQGGWGPEEVALREREPWFDPAGFFLAERAAGTPQARLVGFHWTKVHGGSDDADHGHPPLGEVYIVGVDPAEQGHRLGEALTLTGLHFLQRRGLGTVLLYVDDGNPRAVALYERLGFTRWATDVCYSRT